MQPTYNQVRQTGPLSRVASCCLSGGKHAAMRGTRAPRICVLHVPTANDMIVPRQVVPVVVMAGERAPGTLRKVVAGASCLALMCLVAASMGNSRVSLME